MFPRLDGEAGAQLHRQAPFVLKCTRMKCSIIRADIIATAAYSREDRMPNCAEMYRDVRVGDPLRRCVHAHFTHSLLTPSAQTRLRSCLGLVFARSF